MMIFQIGCVKIVKKLLFIYSQSTLTSLKKKLNHAFLPACPGYVTSIQAYTTTARMAVHFTFWATFIFNRITSPATLKA